MIITDNPDMKFCDASFIEATLNRYQLYTHPIENISYATVRDYCDSWDHLNALSSHGDLKNVQRPWMLKTILSHVPRGGRLLEIGGGHPLIGATLVRMGYNVTVVDPYDGSGNGPIEYQMYVKKFPEVRIIRQFIKPDMDEFSKDKGGFDAIYSISVLEHIPLSVLENEVFPAIRTYLRPQGFSIHAIDMVRKGIGDKDHLKMLLKVAELSGISERDVLQVIEKMDEDVETYYLSAEAHNLWRMGTPYEKFPMRICTGMQICTVIGP